MYTYVLGVGGRFRKVVYKNVMYTYVLGVGGRFWSGCVQKCNVHRCFEGGWEI